MVFKYAGGEEEQRGRGTVCIGKAWQFRYVTKMGSHPPFLWGSLSAESTRPIEHFSISDTIWPNTNVSWMHDSIFTVVRSAGTEGGRAGGG